MREFNGWRKIPGFENYGITCAGSVKNLFTKKIIKPIIRTYPSVRLRRDKKSHVFYVHHLVALVYIGERPNGYEVNHKDGNKMNAHYSNLEYVTHAENMKHAGETGLMGGAKRWNRTQKLHPEEVKRIRGLYSEGHKKKDIAKMFGVSTGNVYQIVNNQIWKHT